MITGLSIQTPEANIEEMNVSGSTLGDGNIDLLIHVIYSELTAEQQSVYDNALSLVGDKYHNEILNTTADLTINRVTSTVLEDGTDTVDFDTLSEADKDKLRDLLAVFVELHNAIPLG